MSTLATDSMSWREAYEQAIKETRDEFTGEQPSQEEFIEAFKRAYNPIIKHNTITLWPIDPPGSHRKAKKKAETAYKNTYEQQ